MNPTWKAIPSRSSDKRKQGFLLTSHMRFGGFLFIHTLFEAISKAFSLASYDILWYGLFGEELQLLPCCRILPLRAFGALLKKKK